MHNVQQLPTISVVIPTLNEAENLPHILPDLPDIVSEVVLVDGGSKDNTIMVAKQLRPDIHTMRQTGKGKGNALAEGFAARNGPPDSRWGFACEIFRRLRAAWAIPPA